MSRNRLPGLDLEKRGRGDSNPQPPDRQSAAAELQVPESQDLTEAPSAACTAACTSEAQNANADPNQKHHDEEGKAASEPVAESGAPAAEPLALLAKAIAKLSAEDRARLIAMLARE